MSEKDNMAYAVRELELTRLPRAVKDLAGYQKIFVLFRYRGIPVGTRLFPVKDGVFDLRGVDDLLTGAIRDRVAELALQYYIGYEAYNTSEPLPSATVAICTRNRAEDLARCLAAVSQLNHSGHEVLVVDNCPSDNSSFDVVQGYPAFRYLREDRPGLDIARNRALAEAKNEIVAFTDDDALPDREWLTALLRPFSHPQVLCVTGMTLPLELETEAQIGFEEYSPFCKGFQPRRFRATHTNPLATGQMGAGANMALRKSLVQQVGGFDEALDAGTATQSGGDHEMFARILARGYEIVYEPSALSWHRHRRTAEELKKAIYGYGSGVYAHWARLFTVEKEYSAAKLPLHWFFRSQLPALGRSLLKRPGSMPSGLLWAELKGCFDGLGNYRKARKKQESFERE